MPAPDIERTVASAAYTILSDEAAIANAALAIGLAEYQLPSLFSLAAAWMKRLQSELEVERHPVISHSVRPSLKGNQSGQKGDELRIPTNDANHFGCIKLQLEGG